MEEKESVNEIANEYAAKNDCDVLLCSGPMGDGLDHAMLRVLTERKHETLLLFLTTAGGDAHIAYRAARHLQSAYTKISVFVSGWCKSAGTLLAVCGNELIVSERGELGPIDVQMGRTDDLWDSSSGLTEMAAVTTLEEIAWSLYRKLVTETKKLSDGQITFKTAADASSPLVSGMLTPIFAQIDPLKLGENARALNIASEYANRLNRHSRNLKQTAEQDSVQELISGYPDHRFVIDRREAEKLFREVRTPDDDLIRLCNALGDAVMYPTDPPLLTFLNTATEEIETTSTGSPDNEKSEKISNITERSARSADVATQSDGSVADEKPAASSTG